MNETEQKIVTGARACLLAEGHTRTSVKRIAEYAGVNHGLIHHYFGSKEQLIIELIEQFQCAIKTRMPAPHGAPDRSFPPVWHLFREDSNDRLLLEFLALATESPRIAEKLREVVQSRRSYLQAMFGLTPEQSATLASVIIGSLIHQQLDADFPMETVVRQVLDSFQPPASA